MGMENFGAWFLWMHHIQAKFGDANHIFDATHPSSSFGKENTQATPE